MFYNLYRSMLIALGLRRKRFRGASMIQFMPFQKISR